MAAGVAAANEQLARVQQVKRWHLLPVQWTAETEELTPTLKLKRRVVHAKYADVIDSLYAGSSPGRSGAGKPGMATREAAPHDAGHSWPCGNRPSSAAEAAVPQER